MTDNQSKKPDLGLLEEDDEFEEFPAEGYTCISLIISNNFSNIQTLLSFFYIFSMII